MRIIRIADWSTTPGARYRRQGPFSAEEFRDDVLLPALKNGPVTVDLGGVAGYAASFLEEVFGGAIRADRRNSCKLIVTSSDAEYDDVVLAAEFATEALLAHTTIDDQPPPTPNSSTPIWELVIADMHARDHTGRARYGTPLQAHNGRDALVDLYQELLDAVVYCRQLIEERKTRA